MKPGPNTTLGIPRNEFQNRVKGFSLWHFDSVHRLAKDSRNHCSLGRVLINAQIAAPLFNRGQLHRLSKTIEYLLSRAV
jgi:hypothetical protein